MKKTEEKSLSTEEKKELLETLQTRFEENMQRHKNMEWEKVKAKLESAPAKLSMLARMKETGGEPDVVGLDEKSGVYFL